MYSSEHLLEGALGLPHVPLASAEAYTAAMPLLRKHTNTVIGNRDDFPSLTGGNPPGMVEDNHRNHTMFMSTVFTIGEYELLAATLPWVYRAYMAHGFSPGYFPEVVKAYMEGVSIHVPRELSGEILEIYSWILDSHRRLLELAGASGELIPPTGPEWLERKLEFLRALLEGDHRKCMTIASGAVRSSEDLERFYMQVVKPAMYEIGALWENDEISVAQEHLASAIVTRMMGALDAAELVVPDKDKRVVVTSSASEFHEIGAWMVSDFFENRGWQVRYLGANTPVSDLLDLLRDFRPSVLALSVTMPFNLVAAKKLIEAVKADDDTAGLKIIVGGRVFNQNEGLWRAMGADGYAPDLSGIEGVIGGWNESA